MTETYKAKTASKCFSLVETLFAVTVIMVLTAVLLPSVQHVKTLTERTKCTSNIRQIHSGMMMFVADHGFFPLGWTGSAAANEPGRKLSPIRRPIVGGVPKFGINTHWQIEVAPYLDQGKVQPSDWQFYSGTPSLTDAVTASIGPNWRLPLALRCPGYNRKLADPKFNYAANEFAPDVHNDHYGYCYNQWALNGNRSTNGAAIGEGIRWHSGRDARLGHTDYAPNSVSDTAMLFCSRWGVLAVKNDSLHADLSATRYAAPGVSSGAPDPTFFGNGTTSPHNQGNGYSGCAAGVHGGRDNFLFLDGHVEPLDPNSVKDRLRMNKSWWRPLPRDGSFGNYGTDNSGEFVAYWFRSSDGYGGGQMYGDGTWKFGAPPAGYNWNR